MSTGCHLQNTDIIGTQIARIGEDSPEQCQAACSATSTCQTWVWSGNSCWLKALPFTGPTKPAAAVISGPKTCPQECVFADVDIANTVTILMDHSPSALVCQERCREHDGCTKWTYIDEDNMRESIRGMCYLKADGGGIPEKIRSGQITSGLKEC